MVGPQAGEHDTLVMWTPGGMDGIRKRIDQLCTNVVDVVELADTVRARNPATVSSRHSLVSLTPRVGVGRVTGACKRARVK